MDYHFFWGGSPLSNFYPCQFQACAHTWTSSEQFFMAAKACFFNDLESNILIRQAKTPREAKKLGRAVKNFDQERWSTVSRNYMYIATYLKFTSDPELWGALKETHGKLLVEASPHDKIWGIGLSEDDAKKTPTEEWPGLNWLGLVLTQLREDLIGKKND